MQVEDRAQDSNLAENSMHPLSRTAAPSKFIFCSLLALIASALLVMGLYWGAAFGNEAAMKALVWAIMPGVNIASAFLPEDLHKVPGGLELVLGAFILQATVVLTVVIYAGSILIKGAAKVANR